MTTLHPALAEPHTVDVLDHLDLLCRVRVRGEDTGGSLAIIEERGLTQVSDDSAIRAVVDEVLAANAEQVERYRSGEQKVFGFLMGETMKALKGQGAPQVVKQVLTDALS